MGSTLSIVNDLKYSCLVTVMTAGGGFVVDQDTVTAGNTKKFDLGKVWYDLKFELQNPSGTLTQTMTVYMGNDVTLALSGVFGPGTVGKRLYNGEDTAKGILSKNELALYLSAGGKEGDHIDRMIEIAKKHKLIGHRSLVPIDSSVKAIEVGSD
ncbi:hypothetical protein Q9L58_008968 [Maublancomyces gigas]|uniref:Uncharacterized protein n=1 Tax=Discina gigas TaxID=1032678 RepID=A0ABR3G8A2_9PEZI